MRLLIYFIIIFGITCLLASGPQAASVYMWTDKDGRMHITDRPPQKRGVVRDIIEYQPGSASEPTGPSRQSNAAEAESSTKEAQCSNVYASRRTLRKTNTVAVAVHRRAEDARDAVKDLRERIGFDEDRRDDFKDDLKRLEEKARWADMFARQADLDVQVAELQLKLAESEADADCPER